MYKNNVHQNVMNTNYRYIILVFAKRDTCEIACVATQTIISVNHLNLLQYIF